MSLFRSSFSSALRRSSVSTSASPVQSPRTRLTSLTPNTNNIPGHHFHHSAASFAVADLPSSFTHTRTQCDFIAPTTCCTPTSMNMNMDMTGTNTSGVSSGKNTPISSSRSLSSSAAAAVTVTAATSASDLLALSRYHRSRKTEPQPLDVRFNTPWLGSDLLENELMEYDGQEDYIIGEREREREKEREKGERRRKGGEGEQENEEEEDELIMLNNKN